MKKKKQQPEKPKTVRCPLRGHNHELPLIPHPNRPDLLIAQCSGRDVYQARTSDTPRPVDPDIAGFNYVVPHYDERE